MSLYLDRFAISFMSMKTDPSTSVTLVVAVVAIHASTAFCPHLLSTTKLASYFDNTTHNYVEAFWGSRLVELVANHKVSYKIDDALKIISYLLAS